MICIAIVLGVLWGLVLVSPPASAEEAPEFAWIRQFGSSVAPWARSAAADASGVYVAGHTDGALPGQTSAGGADAFLRKYDPNGNELWTHQFGSPANDAANGVALDGSGVYVAGETRGALPGQTDAGWGDAFLRKYDPSGIELWTRQFGTPSTDEAFGVALDGSGVYVTGRMGGDAFLRKYDPNGNELWTRQSAAPGYEDARAVAVDESGVYVAGLVEFALPGQTSAGSTDAFLRKYDPNGNELWTRQFGTSSEDWALGVAADGSGAYVAGQAYGALPGQTSAGGADAFLRKYDPSGTELWTRQFGSSGHDPGARGVAADGSGAYVVGSTDGVLPGQTSPGGADAFLRKYDPNRNELWTRQFGSSSSDAALGVAADGSGAYVVGYMGGYAFVAKVGADTVAPALTLTSPAAGTTTSTPTVTVSGATEPGARLVVNGIVIDVAPDGSFSFQLALHEGTNEINATATDAAGNAASASVTVTYVDAIPGLQQQLEEAKDELAATRDELTATQDELAATKEELAGTRRDLQDTQAALEAATAQLTSLGTIFLLGLLAVVAVFGVALIATYRTLGRRIEGPPQARKEEPPNRVR